MSRRLRVLVLSALLGAAPRAGIGSQSSPDWDAAWDRLGASPAPPTASDAAESATDIPQPLHPPAAVAEPTTPTRTPLQRPLRSEPSSPAAKRSPAALASDWFRPTAALGAVLALIGLLAWGYRAVAGGTSGRVRLAGGMEVVGRLALTPRQGLCLVRLGPRLVLLGVGNDGVRSLDVLEHPDHVAQVLGQAFAAGADGSSAGFRKALAGEDAQYASAEARSAVAERTTAAGRAVPPGDSQKAHGALRRTLEEAQSRLKSWTST